MMKNLNIRKITKNGFSLIEMVIVIIIIGILLAGLMKMTGATKGAKVSTLNQNIVNLATAATSWGQQSNDGSYQNISVSQLVSTGLLSKVWSNGAKSKNPFAGGLSIAPSSDDNGFVVTADKIPDDVCTKYGTSNGTHKISIPTADSWKCTGGILKVGFGTNVAGG